MTIIPLTDQPRQRVILALFGARVALEVYWHPLSASWYADVAVDNRQAVLGRRLAVNENVAANIRDERFIGSLICRSMTKSRIEPAYHAWGVTHQMIHELP